MTAVYNIAPKQTEDAIQAGVEGIKSKVGDVQRGVKHRLQYDGDRVAVKEEYDKLLRSKKLEYDKGLNHMSPKFNRVIKNMQK